MTKETINTTNKFILPANGDVGSEEARRQIVENLQKITPEQARAVGEELEKKQKEQQEREREAPQSLLDFRKAWEERINNIDNASKEKIIKAVENIPVKVEIESDGSRLIEFKLGSKTRKILYPKLEKYSEGFRPDWSDSNGHYDSIKRIYDYNYVKLAGMRGDDVENWKNKKLKDYVKEKKNEGLDIATKKQIGEILSSLGEKAELDSEPDRIAMLMYLTGMDGWYWLKDTSGSSCSRLFCVDGYRVFSCNSRDHSSASLCLIACQ